MAKIYDLNRMRKTYPLIRKKPRNINIDAANIETTIIDISDGQPKSYVFQNKYKTVPVVVATPEQENVNVFISSISLLNVIIEISAIPPDNCFVHLQIFEDTSV